MTRDIAKALRAFARERYPVAVALPVALCACLGPQAVAAAGWRALARAVVITYLILFALRIVDDIVSVDDDRRTHPARALVSGRVSVPHLAAGAALLSAAAILSGLGWLSLGLCTLALYYAGYFLLSKRLPKALEPWLVNVVFFAIPVQMDLIQATLPRASLCVLGVFFWLSAVGHDYAHSVHAEGELPPDVESLSGTLGSRNAALLGLACYVAAFVVGAFFAFRLPGFQPVPRLFLMGVTLLFAWVSMLLIRLLARPCAVRAKPLYAAGFAFFLIPSALLWLDYLL